MSRGQRKQEILETFALMLESNPGTRVTTAALATKIGVSEAALYRHFPSKAKMIEGLIEFMESIVFSRINKILAEDMHARARCSKVLLLVLTFAEKNPGFSRLQNGDALQGESDRLRIRIKQYFDRLETHLRQIIREGQLRKEIYSNLSATVISNLFMATVEGRISQYVRTEFKSSPIKNWEAQWLILERSIFTGSSKSDSGIS
ncbi:MAG: nucleoid occlusion factor SlmA [Pseudomonadales bacterium]|nr:nucleoid occlusion factor SlmA [Pseudomonadales bacterium]